MSLADYKINYANGTDTPAAATIRYSYSYNTDGSLTSVNLSSPNVSGSETFAYDVFDRVSSKTNSYQNKTTSVWFTNETDYTYSEYNSRTSGQISSYTSTINDGTSITYTYTYDQNGNITKIVYSTGEEIRYEYDDLGQLTREDNELIGMTYVYTYDNAGNRISKEVYQIVAEGVIPANPTSTHSYGYATGAWGDVLTSYRGHTITYDAIGNPLSYYNGSSYTFTWTGRRLASATKGGLTYTYTYNDEGIRTSKTVNGVTTTYYLNGSQIVGEETSGNITLYLYDASGSPVGMQYHGASYAADVWDTYYFEKNLQGDVVAVYDTNGTKLISYAYDAWGIMGAAYSNGGINTTATKNPFTYRGYYYDSDIGLYYLQTRYYDAKIGRFISPDTESVITATPDALTDKNLYAYCDNNPVMRVDEDGEFWNLVKVIVMAVVFVDKYIVPDREEHYARNEMNIEGPDTFNPDAIKDENDFFYGWKTNVSAKCHQFTDPDKRNIKLVSPDGNTSLYMILTKIELMIREIWEPIILFPLLKAKSGISLWMYCPG